MTVITGADDLQGLLVISLEQAVAAPYAAGRLADAGARVIKVERPEGDFARGYDADAKGQSSYFVWLNRGKESVALNLKQADDLQILKNMISKADIFIQNLMPLLRGKKESFIFPLRRSRAGWWRNHLR